MSYRYPTKTAVQASRSRKGSFTLLYLSVRDTIIEQGDKKDQMTAKELLRWCALAKLGADDLEVGKYLRAIVFHVGQWARMCAAAAQQMLAGKRRTIESVTQAVLDAGLPEHAPGLNTEPYLDNIRRFYEQADQADKGKLQRGYLVKHPKELRTMVRFDRAASPLMLELTEAIFWCEMAFVMGWNGKTHFFQDPHEVIDAIADVLHK